MMSIGSVKSAGSAGNYYTDKDNYYVIGSMDERWQGKGAEALGIDGKAVDKTLIAAQHSQHRYTFRCRERQVITGPVLIHAILYPGQVAAIR